MAKKRTKPRKWQVFGSGVMLAAGLILVALSFYRPGLGRMVMHDPARVTSPSPPADTDDVKSASSSVARSEPVARQPPPVSPPEQVAVVPPPRPPVSADAAWRRNAIPSGPEDRRPMIAIVLDDMGLDRKRSAEAMTLPAPLTMSFLAYAPDLAEQTAAAHARGHELMLHIPMEPIDRKVDPGMNALRTSLDDDEIHRRLTWDLDRITGIVGANNHMGSGFTQSVHGMTLVEETLRDRGLFVLDSRTTPMTVVIEVADRIGIPHAKRDVFLDDDMSAKAVGTQLARTEDVARRNGFAIAIGHPHDATMAELRSWLPAVAARGFRLVPVSAIVQHNEAVEAKVDRVSE